MKTILITNDDGYLAQGLITLKKYLEKLYNVFVVAPDRERSAVSMALTLNNPLRINRISERVFTINGTPSDCVNIGIQKILPSSPDFIISGMNHGENLSEDIFFSGTVGGAFSGYLYDIPSMAVSLVTERNKYTTGNFDFDNGARITEGIFKKLLKLGAMKVVYNVNIPENTNGKVIITTLGNKRYRPNIIENTDPRGKKYFWIGTGLPSYNGGKGTDVWAVSHKYISLSLLNYDFNATGLEKALQGEFDEI